MCCHISVTPHVVMATLFSTPLLSHVMKTALILAGGKAHRFCGQRKAFLLLKGKPLLQWVIEVVNCCVDEIILSGDEDLKSFGYPVVEDQFSHLGPIAAFHSGFSVIKSEYTFVTGCDMPFISRELILYLFENARGYSFCLPRKGSFIEPLCCVYNTEDVKSCLTSVIAEGKKRLYNLIQCLPRPRYISYAQVRTVDPHLLSFTNINTYEDLLKAETML